MPAPNYIMQQAELDFHKLLASVVNSSWEAGFRAGKESAAEDLTQKVREAFAALKFEQSPAANTIFPGVSVPDPRMSPQKRGAQNRAPRGVVKKAIFEAIKSYSGATREQIRAHASRELGSPIKEGSLKQGLRLLRLDGKIENKNRLWFVANEERSLFANDDSEE